jgi:hypothetical protein
MERNYDSGPGWVEPGIVGADVIQITPQMRILAGTEAAVEGTLCVVAERKPAHAGAASAPGPVPAGRRQPGCDRCADVAAGERVVTKQADHPSAGASVSYR